jgi:hypothetical protein
MAWMHVTLKVAGETVPNVIQTDQIKRVGPLQSGCYIEFADGKLIEVTDNFQEVLQLLHDVDKAKTK